MRLKNVPGSREAIAQSRFVIHDPQEQKGKWAEAFGRKAPLHIEIGTGKGRFLMELAALHPEIDYIGIEKYSSVLLRAIQKMEERELPNVRFIRMDAEEITEVFGPRRSGPHLPEFFRSLAQGPARQEKASLRQFLNRYAQILKPEGTIEFKTDNRALFDFALEELEPAGWQAEEVT